MKKHQSKLFSNLAIILLLCFSMQVNASEATKDKIKTKDKQAVAASLAKVYLTNLNKAQLELLKASPTRYESILMLLAGALNVRYIKIFEYESEKNNVALDNSSHLKAMSIGISKLAVFAQQIGKNDALACHMQESQNLEAAVQGKEKVNANCRLAVYGDLEIDAMQFMASDEGKKLEPIMDKWLKNTINYSIDAACISGYCW